MVANSMMASIRQTTIEVLGITFKVFNAAPQRRNAMAYDLRTGRAYTIGCGRIDITDRDDVEARILEVLAWKSEVKSNRYN